MPCWRREPGSRTQGVAPVHDDPHVVLGLMQHVEHPRHFEVGARGAWAEGLQMGHEPIGGHTEAVRVLDQKAFGEADAAQQLEMHVGRSVMGDLRKGGGRMTGWSLDVPSPQDTCRSQGRWVGGAMMSGFVILPESDGWGRRTSRMANSPTRMSERRSRRGASASSHLPTC